MRSNRRFNPFPGLRSFEPDEEHLFFGREQQTDEVLGRLRRNRFLAVVGTSGSGKSSLVRSGLIPSLYSGFLVKAGSSWRVALFRPGSDPVANLAAALGGGDVLGDGEPLDSVTLALVEATLRRSAMGLADSVGQARLPAGENVLVIIDQFEELFRFKQARATVDARNEAVAFVKLLLEGARHDAVPLYIVVTMRSDFIGHCTEFPGLPEAVNDGQFLVPRMTRDELRLAITGPVAVGGGEITPRLVTRLLNDVGDDPDQLPVLQHALMRTWDHWERRRGGEGSIDLEDYEAIGTMKNALSQHAEEAYAELDGDRARLIAERMFKALTDKNPEAGGVRRPCRVDEICQLAEATRDDVIRVVERFRAPGRSFLMPPAAVELKDASILDLSHESLMRVWSRLAEWAREEDRAAEIYRRLSQAAHLYERGEVGLWRDPELQLALTWRAAAQPTAAWAQRYDPNFDRAMAFLRDSENARDVAIAEQERQRRQQLVWARRAAAVMGALFLIAVALAASAFRLWTQASEQRLLAEDAARAAQEAAGVAQQARQLAEDREREARDAKLAADGEAEKARMEKERADRETELARQASDSARQAEGQARSRQREAEEQRDARAKAERETREQAELALEARMQAETARDAATRSAAEAERLSRLALSRALAELALRPWSADQRAAAALLARQAYLLHQESLKTGGLQEDPTIYAALSKSLRELEPDRPAVFQGHGDAVRAVAVSGDGALLATASDDGYIRLFDAGEPGSQPIWVGELGTEARAVAFDPEGGLLAAGGFDGSLLVWNLRRPADAPARLAGHTAAVSALAFGRGGRLMSGGFDGQVRLWRSESRTGEAILLDRHPYRVTSVALSAAGTTAAAGTDGGGILLWDLSLGRGEPRPFAEHPHVSSIALSPDGSALAAGTREGRIVGWDLARAPGAPLVDIGAHESGVTALSFGTGGLLASSSLDGDVKLWYDLWAAPDREPIVLSDHASWVWSVAISPDGERVFSGGADQTARAWLTHTQPMAGEVCRRVARDLTLDEWHAYVSLAIPYESTCGPVAADRNRK